MVGKRVSIKKGCMRENGTGKNVRNKIKENFVETVCTVSRFTRIRYTQAYTKEQREKELVTRHPREKRGLILNYNSRYTVRVVQLETSGVCEFFWPTKMSARLGWFQVHVTRTTIPRELGKNPGKKCTERRSNKSIPPSERARHRMVS